MERFILNQRMIAEKNNAESTCGKRTPCHFDVKRRGFVWSFRTFALAVSCAAVVGCAAIGDNASGATFRRGSDYIMGGDVAEAWKDAAKEQYSENDEKRHSVMKPAESYFVETAYTETDNPSSGSFTERIKGMFHVPGSKNAAVTNADGAYENYAENNRSKNYQKDDGRTTFATSDVAEKERSGSFWSKMFPSKKTNDQEIRPYSQSLTEQNYAQDNPYVASNQTYARTIQQNRYVQQRQTLANEQARSVYETRQNSAANAANQVNPFKGRVERLVGRVRPIKDSQAERRALLVEKYDQSRFIPGYKDIEKFYRPSGVVVARTAGQVAQNSGMNGLAIPHVDTVRNSSAYGSSIYGVTERKKGQNLVKQNADPRERRGGAAFISPILHADGSMPTRREGSANGKTPGVTRQFSGVELDRDVAQVSYAQRNYNYGEKQLKPDSLFGWSQDTERVLYDIEGTKERNIDFDFVSELGKQPDKSWFETTETNPENRNELDASNVTLGQDYSDNVLENLDSVQAEGEILLDEPQVVEKTNEHVVVADPNATLDDVFDAAVSANENENVDELEEESTESEDSQENCDYYNGDDVRENEETPTEMDAFPNFEPGVQAEDLDSVENASMLTEAAEQVVEQTAEPLEETQSKQEFSDVNEVLTNLTNENVVNASTPDSLDARKNEQAATPLTKEEIAWVEQVKCAIQSLIAEREQLVERGADTRTCDARLRLLYLVIGEYDRSIQAIQDDSDPLKIFWEKECRGLETLLRNRLEEIDPTFVAERLRAGLDSLAGLCNIKIRKALLVDEPACYGLYEVRKGTYVPGDVVYAYAELDFVTSKESKKGFEINVECRWRLLARDGRQIVPFESQRCVNVSETKLQDVVLNVSVPLPEKIASGEYILELEVVDMNADEPTTSVKKLELNVEAQEKKRGENK